MRKLKSLPILLVLTAGAAPSEASAATRIRPGSPAGVSAPTLTRPMDERRFDFEQPAEGLITFAWEPVRDAALYRLQVSGDESFSKLANPRHQLLFGEPMHRAEIAGLPAGGYYLRVAAVDAEGRQGSWSTVRRFSVNEGPPPAAGAGPALKITSSVPAGSMVIIRGSSAPGVRVEATVNGATAGEATTSDDGSFSIMVEANAIGINAVRLLAIDRSGRSSSAETSFHYGG